jgi:signal transduction histidine kinase/ligand-binding sensor domain-containing protein
MARWKKFLPKRHFLFAVLAAEFIFAISLSLGATPADFLVDKWDTGDGLPSSTVTAIEQTPDGYLWIGTYNGLARFDGARFVTFDPVNQPELGQSRVQGLFLDANGTLWINTFRGGLTSYRAGEFRNELPDRPAFDVHTTLAVSTTNRVTFVTQFGEVLEHNLAAASGLWRTTAPPAGSLPIFQCADAAGRLWFLTRDWHILQYYQGEFKMLADDGGLSGSKINTLVADAQGRVWAGAENEIALWDGKQFSAMTPTNGEADIDPRGMFPLKSGSFWVLDGLRLRKLEGRAWTAEIPAWRGLLGAASGRAMGVHEDGDGGLWFNHYGNGLFHIAADGSFQRLTSSPDNLPSDRHLPNGRVGAWFQGRDGGVWAGVDHGGLARLRERRFHVIGPAEGLPARTALSVCEDKNGAMWIGTAGGGLSMLSPLDSKSKSPSPRPESSVLPEREARLKNFAVGPSASANFIFSIAFRPEGGAWLSGSEGEDLYQLLDGRIQRASWELHGIKCILVDRQQRVWIGLKSGSGLARWAGGERRILNFGTNSVSPAVRALAETPDGNIWAGADDGTIFRCELDELVPFRPQDELADQPIYSMLAETNGTLWAGTFRGGLLRFKDGKFSRIAAKQGLPAEVISQILDDGQRLWLGTQQGIYSVAKSALNALADGRVNTLDFVSYGRHDGIAPVECSGGYQPACWRASDGKLWFTTLIGAVWVQPEEIITKSVPPPVLVEEVRVDGELVDHAELTAAGKNFAAAPASTRPQPISISPGHKQIDFRFTALSFDGGDQARFRYRVDGLDADWVDWDTRRTVSLRNLPPREYRFHVIACNSDGAWNLAGAEVKFVVEPFFYQRLTFRIIAGILIVGGVSFAVRRAATRKYRRKLALLEQQHAVERDRARIAKDIHDDVGAGLTQITLLTELARREPAQAEANLGRITDSARRLTKAMDEIVWAVDPQHDTLAGLMDYVSAYAEDFLRVAEIRCRMDLPMTLPVLRVEAELRYNLFLALKETLNNIVKHAQASEVWLRLKLEGNHLTLIVEDNGRGLAVAGVAETDRLRSGYGLGNLARRLESVGGRCAVHSEGGRGTRVEFSAALQGEPSPVVAIGGDGTMP